MKLQLTAGYKPEFVQISRILNFLSLKFGQKRVLPKEIEDHLGMSELQVKFLSYLSVAFGLMEPYTFVLTDFGKFIVDRDGFFESIDTLWIIHYIISSNPDWIVWYRMINQVFPMNDIIDYEISTSYFSDLTKIYSNQSMEKGLVREINVVLWAYTESELARLNLLVRDESTYYKKGVPVEISNLAFLFCILHYHEHISSIATALTIEEICRGVDSPGLVLSIPETNVRSLLENLHYTGLVRLEQLGDLDQLRFSDSLTKLAVLNQIYKN